MTASIDTLCPPKRVHTAIDECLAEESMPEQIIRKRAAALCFFKGYARPQARRGFKTPLLLLFHDSQESRHSSTSMLDDSLKLLFTRGDGLPDCVFQPFPA